MAETARLLQECPIKKRLYFNLLKNKETRGTWEQPSGRGDGKCRRNRFHQRDTQQLSVGLTNNNIRLR